MTSAPTETPQDAACRLACGRKLEALHVYRDVAGDVIYHRIRARDHGGEKWIRPMRLTGHSYELGEPDFPNGKPLYKLDRIAANPEAPVWIVEGEKPVGALTKIGAVATTSGGAQSAKAADWTPLRGRACRLWADNDDAGRAYMGEVAAILQGLGCRLSAVDVDALGLPPKGDAWDWAHANPNATLADLDELKRTPARSVKSEVANPSVQSATPTATELDAARLAELAALPMLEYDRARESAAEQLGIRLGTLDGEVAKKRTGPRRDTGAGEAPQLLHLEPWPDPVDGAALLDELASSARRHLVLPRHADAALALWVLFTHTIEAAATAPILAVVSPEKRCGKTTLLDWLSRLVHKPLPGANVSPAALFRAVEEWQPTLLIDEADAFLSENEELRGVLNSGHTRSSAFVLRVEGDPREVRRFSTWGAKAIALIGKLPDTLADRSITVEMRRRMPSEQVHKLRGEIERRNLEEISRRCQRFAMDALAQLKQADPKIPSGLNDRAADSWTPLLAIADIAGGEWPASARTAASVLSGASPDGDSLKVELLRDVRAVLTGCDPDRPGFSGLGRDRLSSTELAEILAKDPERPWAEFGRGKAITVRQLARLLNAFGICSGTVRLADGKTLKGYKLEDFADAFARYLPPCDPSQRHTQAPARVVTDLLSVTKQSCDGSLLPSQPRLDAGCDGVTDEIPPPASEIGSTLEMERF